MQGRCAGYRSCPSPASLQKCGRPAFIMQPALYLCYTGQMVTNPQMTTTAKPVPGGQPPGLSANLMAAPATSLPMHLAAVPATDCRGERRSPAWFGMQSLSFWQGREAAECRQRMGCLQPGRFWHCRQGLQKTRSPLQILQDMITVAGPAATGQLASIMQPFPCPCTCCAE